MKRRMNYQLTIKPMENENVTPEVVEIPVEATEVSAEVVAEVVTPE